MAVAAKGRRLVQGGTLEHAVALLDGANLPVIGGLLTDSAGTEAAIALDRYDGIGPASFGVPGGIAGRPQRLATVPCRT
jgi:hypothetical protein